MVRERLWIPSRFGVSSLSAASRIRTGAWRCMNGTADAISAGGPTPTRTHIRPRPPARDNNPSRKLIEDDGRAVRGPTSLLLARGRPTKPIDRTKEQRRKNEGRSFCFFFLQHAADGGRRTTCSSTRNPTSCPPSRQRPLHATEPSPAGTIALPCPSLFSIPSLGTEKEARKMRHTRALGPPRTKTRLAQRHNPAEGRVDDLSTNGRWDAVESGGGSPAPARVAEFTEQPPQRANHWLADLFVLIPGPGPFPAGVRRTGNGNGSGAFDWQPAVPSIW